MTIALANNRDPNALAVRLRRKRFAVFLELAAPLPRPIRILDVGGTQIFWELIGFNALNDVTVTILNMRKEPTNLPNFHSVVGDARRMDFQDKAFDVVFSNSVIEHVGSYADQGRMASEVIRVGKRYFVQTPNKYFPIEPHFLFPMFQFLPIPMRIWLLQHVTLGWCKKTPDFDAARKVVEEVQLLSRREFLHLFPGASLHTENFYGLPKSFTVYGGW